MTIEYMDKKVCCPKCESPDTKAILDTETEVGIIWCSCGLISVLISAGMSVNVKRA